MNLLKMQSGKLKTKLCVSAYTTQISTVKLLKYTL